MRAALLALLCACAVADEPRLIRPERVGMSAPVLDTIQPSLRQLVVEGRLAGAVSLVARAGELVHLEAVGLRDRETGAPMPTDAIFRLYSMSKPLTSAGALVLVDAGKLELDAPIARYLPEFADPVVLEDDEERPVRRLPTVRDLLRHTSGLSYGMGLNFVDFGYHGARVFDPDADLAEICRRIAEVPLLFQPGTRWRYSLGIDVLGRIIEVVSGQALDVFLEESLFAPLGMRDTGFVVPRSEQQRIATMYLPTWAGLQPFEETATTALLERPPGLWGGAGLVSTAVDYFRFLQMLIDDGMAAERRVLSSRAVELMTTDQLPAGVEFAFGPPTPDVGFGLGLSVQKVAEDPKRVGECSWGGAASTRFYFHPERRLVALVMAASFPIDPEIGETVARAAYRAHYAGE